LLAASLVVWVLLPVGAAVLGRRDV